MYVLYTLLLLVYGAAVLPSFFYRSVRSRAYFGTLGERLGRVPAAVNPDGRATIWVHGVSVGEVLAARALLPGLRAAYPDLRLVLSVTTLAGRQVAAQQSQLVDACFFFPFDLPGAVSAVLERLRPRLFVTIDTEIWPNLLRACRQRGVPAVVVNGRISDRSYRRYRLVRPLFARVLADVDRFCMQSEAWAARVAALGAPPERVTVTGSLKFDAASAAAVSGRAAESPLRHVRVPEGRPVLIAASTLRGEEAAVLRAYRGVRAGAPGTLLVLAPRHPERFAEAEQLASREGHRVVRRTALRPEAGLDADVLILDTIGELARLYELATVVFVGGSLVEAGGHNILEPAAFSKPIVFGPSMHNFADIADAFLRQGAAWQVQSESDLERALVTLMADAARRDRMGAAARAVLGANRGATERTLAVIADVLGSRWSLVDGR